MNMKFFTTLLLALAVSVGFGQVTIDEVSNGTDIIRVEFSQDLPIVAPQQGQKITSDFLSRKAGGPADTCGVDTVEYPLVGKASGLQLWEIDGTAYQGFGQYYDAPQDIVVEGVKFYGYLQDNSFNGNTVDVWVKIYDASPVDSMPSVVALDSALVTMDESWDNLNIENGAYVAMFNTPVTVSSAYFLSLENVGTDTIVTLSNSVTNSDGAGENLGFYEYQGVWYRNIDFILFDADWILHPIVKYEFRADFSLLPDSLCLPQQGGFDTVCTTNLVSPIHGNRMYNQDVNSLTYFWDWGTGLTSVGFEPCSTYDSPGDYTITQTDTIIGWQTTCISAQTGNVHVQQVPFVTFLFTPINATDLDFTSTGTNGTSFYWDFGDSQNSTLEDPSHTYGAAGTYEVWHYIYNECGVDSSSQAIFITVGQEELELDALIEVFPNPSNGEFQVQIIGNETLQLQVFNAVGQKVDEMTLGIENEVDLSAQPAGIYWLRFTNYNATVTKQVQVLR
jgi:hypothetical protein